MNAERLHVIAKEIKKELAETSLEENLQQLINSLQNQINEPQQPAHQQQLSKTLMRINEALSSSASNRFSPAWLQLLDEMGVRDLLGLNLKRTIDEIFFKNQITPSVAQSELGPLLNRVIRLRESIDQILTAFKSLKIGAEELAPGECEVGFLVPRSFVGNHLKAFGKELGELDAILETFAEVSTGTRSGLSIRTISSSDLTVYLDMAPPACACFAVAVERVVALYKQLLEIRKLRRDLENTGVPAEKLAGIEDHAESLMSNGIEEIAKFIMDRFYTGKDNGRKSELEISVKYSLKKVANRIDRGFNIDIRAEPLPEAAADDEETTDSKNARADIASVLSASETLQFMKLEGNPILTLPESQKEEKKK